MDFVAAVIIVLISYHCVMIWADECETLNKCSCRTSQYTIDLSSIQGSVSAYDPLHVYKYEYGVCEPLLSTACGASDVAVCQEQGSFHYIAGRLSSAQFSGDPAENTLEVHYEGDDLRKSIVKLICSDKPAPTFISEGESPQNTYNFRLETSYACISEPAPEPEKSGISTGSVLLILFFVFLAVYFVGGILFLKFVRRAQGKEMFPNYEFWSALPGLVKDGMLFTCRGCKTESSYSQI